MTSPSSKAFIISALIYAILMLGGYWLFTLPTNTPKKIEDHPSVVPVTLAMFQASIPQAQPVLPPATKPEAVKQTESPLKEMEIEKPKIEKSEIEKPKPVQPKSPEPKKVQVKPIEIKKAEPINTPIQKTPPPKISPPKAPEPKITEPKVIESKVTEPKTAEAPLKKATQEKPIIEKTATTPSSTPKPAATPPKYSSEQTAVAEQAYLAELRNQIAQYAHNTYPTRAKRRHWEGVVLIQFTLLKNGHITHLKIIESSGRQVLDNAATTIFQAKMKNQFKPFPEEIQRSDWQIKVPVGYHLK